jgi:dienelactone hydrolase
MKTQAVKVKLRDGEMGAYVAIPDRTPAGAIIAIMEIWGVNDTMRRHAHEFAQAGFVCLVPDLFWRQEPGVELSDRDPEHVKKAFDLYYDFDYDLAVRDMEDTWHFLQRLPECNGKVGAVGSRSGPSVTVSAASSVTSCAAAPTSTARSPTTAPISSTTSARPRTSTGHSCCTWR